MNRCVIEGLERRVLFTVYVVNSTANEIALDGAITLAEAVQASVLNAQIVHGDATDPLIKAGSPNGDVIRFAPSLTGQTIHLTGAGLLITDDLTIDGQNRNITIDAGGSSPIFYAGAPNEQVRIRNLTLINGRGQRGGAVYVQQGNVFLNHLTIRDSVSFYVPPSLENRFGNGGSGIYVDAHARLTLTNSTIANNTENGLFAFHDSIVTIRNTIFSGNTGGALGMSYAYGGLPTVSVFGSTFIDNTSDGIGGAAIGGAATLTIQNSTFRNNVSAGSDSSAAGGGAVFNVGPTTIRNTLFEQNRVNSGNGGAVLLEYDATLARVRFINNSAGGETEGPLGDVVNINYTYGMGGGLAIVSGANVTLQNNWFEGNQADFFGGAIAATSLGGISPTVLNAFGTVVVNNVASSIDGGGGGIGNLGGNVTLAGGRINTNAAHTGGGVMQHAGSTTLRNVQLDSNTASTSGGGIRVDGGTLDARFSRIRYNTAGGDGGGIFSDSASVVTLASLRLIGNHAGGDGGGYYNAAGASATLTNTLITDHVALGAGGGVFNAGTLIATGGQIRRSTATDGGGLFADDAAVTTLLRTIVVANLRNNFGGDGVIS